MVVDTSALVSVHLEESGYVQLLDRIHRAETILAGAPTLLETAIVVTHRLGRDARSEMTALLHRLKIRIVPFTADHSNVAIEAFLRYGKGRHPAALNFGDCQSYAVAAVAGMPLLYTGNDFTRTEIRSALA